MTKITRICARPGKRPIPVASDHDFDTFLSSKLSIQPDELKAHDNAPVAVSFPGQAPPKGPILTAYRELDVKVQGLDLSDKDGLEVRSKDDLQGTVKSLDAHVDLQFGGTAQLLKEQLADAARSKIGFLVSVSADDIHITHVPAQNGQLERQVISVDGPGGRWPPCSLRADVLGRLVVAKEGLVGNLLPDSVFQTNVGNALSQYAGVKTVSEHDDDGNLVFRPQALHVDSELVGGELPPALKGAQLDVTGQMAFKMDAQGLGFQVRNGQIKGSSDANGPEAVPRRGNLGDAPDAQADQIHVNKAELTASLGTNPDHPEEVTVQGEVRDLDAEVDVKRQLSEQDVTLIKHKIDEVSQKIDDSLARYGVNRQLVEDIIQKVGKQQIETLLNSANPQSVSDTAKQFGLDQKQVKGNSAGARWSCSTSTPIMARLNLR